MATFFTLGGSVANAQQERASGAGYLQQILHGGIVNSADITLQIARIVVTSLYGADELARQNPLIAEDGKDRWIVRGSYNADKKLEGPGPFYLVIMKSD